jgi:hypothetical protein
MASTTPQSERDSVGNGQRMFPSISEASDLYNESVQECFSQGMLNPLF